MDQDTPAFQLKTKDLAANCRAVRRCLLRIPPSQISQIIDIRYGLGGWAKIAANRFPKSRLLGFEQSQRTAVRAWINKRVTLRIERFALQSRLTNCSLLLADFNTLTVLKRQPLDQAIEIVQPRWLVFTDTACCYLHLNYRRYGLSKPCTNEYWRGFRIKDYRLTFYSREHRAASTALYVHLPKRKRPQQKLGA